MSRKHALTDDDAQLFRSSVAGTKMLPQDTYVHRPDYYPFWGELPSRKVMQEEMDASFYFSNEFQLQSDSNSLMRYMRPGSSHYELKKLQRGNYLPDLFLDLHGLTKLQAKKELGSLLAACRREHVYCAGIMHGHGKHILKQQIPFWLAQHPDVLAFHQAPKGLGGDAALLVLVELDVAYGQIKVGTKATR
ncbi:MAG: endonuclease SmrB [Candidatus Malihini olakiniferum]